jgi:hypothetical protein
VDRQAVGPVRRRGPGRDVPVQGRRHPAAHHHLEEAGQE